MSVLPMQPPLTAESKERAFVPPLENGDRLGRAEFERRYSAMPEVKKAELIQGIVYMPSPVRHTRHGRQHLLVSGWIARYLFLTPGIDGSDNATVRLDDDNEPQPDLLLRLPDSAGGHSKVTDDGYLEGSAELVIEIASSSVSLDMHAKLETYRSHGALEYMVWRVDDRAIDWFELRDGQYARLQPEQDGVLRSRVFSGLWLDPAALLGGDYERLIRVLDAGIASPEHAAFVERLKENR